MKYRKIVALILLALSGLGEYYVYDSMTSIDSMIKSQLGFTGAQFGLLYSFYSVANVFFLVLFFAGILVDIWGYQKSGLLFITLCVLGAALTAMGAEPTIVPEKLRNFLQNAFYQNYSVEFKIMAIGRMVFGIGAEALLIVIMKALSLWFGAKKVGFAYAFSLVFYRLGAFLSLNLQAKMALMFGLNQALWFATYVMAGALVVYCIYLVFDKVYKPDQLKETKREGSFKFKEISYFPLSFWYVTLVCITFYGVITSFEIFDPDILKQRFGYGLLQSSFLASLLLVTTMILMPFFGFLIDRIGKRASFMTIGSLIAALSLFWLIVTRWPIVAIVLMGVSYSMVAVSIWASVPVVIEKKYQGTAFGILTYVQNVGLMLFPWLTGYIADMYTQMQKGIRTVNYLPVILFFILVMIASFVFSFLLRLRDKEIPQEGTNSVEEFKET